MVAASMSGPRVVACLPAFNEEHHIASVLVRLRGYVDLVIVCDDGSLDLTGKIAEAMGAVLVRHEKNLGYGAALRSLFRAALERGADVAVTIDADEQHDPSELMKLVDTLREGGYDIVIGSRFTEDNHNHVPGWRKAGIELINRLSTKGDLSDSQSGFRAYSRKALESLELTEDGMGVSTEILLRAEEAGLRIGEVPISIRYYKDSSTHNPVVHGLEVVLSTVKHLSVRRPLLFFGGPGFMIIILSVIMWAYAFQVYTATGFFSTNLAVMSMVITLIGLTLVTTSLIIWVMVSVVKERE